MIGALIRDNIVYNLIVLKEEQIAEISAALGCEIADARPWGLAIGDMRTGMGWTRNAGGEQMVLPLLDTQEWDSYTVAVNRAIEAERQVEAAAEIGAEEAAAEAMAILTGEVEA